MREGVRASLVQRLEAQRHQLVHAAIERLRAVPGPRIAEDDADCLESLRSAMSAGLDVYIACIRTGRRWAGPLPAPIVAQARRAARSGITLETILRRCAAASALAAELAQLAGQDLAPETLREVLAIQASEMDHLMSMLAEEFTAELARLADAPEHRKEELVRRVLAGGSPDCAEIGYDLDCRHLGLIASGSRARRLVETIESAHGGQTLRLSPQEDTVWLWLGGYRVPDIASLERALSGADRDGTALAVGEPAQGVDGFRLTHRQAQAGLWIALRRLGRLTRYADAPLLATALKEEVLAITLRERFLGDLLAGEGPDCATLRTLRAYLDAQCNAASTAAALGVDRHTVHRRLRRIEERLGCSIHSRRAELEVALSLQELPADTNGHGPARPARAR